MPAIQPLGGMERGPCSHNESEGSIVKNTPQYIKALLTPSQKSAPSRRVWSIDLETVWVPFFTATNVMGDTAIPSEDLGAPLRLAKARDGSVRFSQSGRPSLRVAPNLNEHIRVVRENFVAGLLSYAGQVMEEKQQEYAAQVHVAQQAATPINEAAQADIEEALARMAAAEAECQDTQESEETPEPQRAAA